MSELRIIEQFRPGQFVVTGAASALAITRLLEVTGSRLEYRRAGDITISFPNDRRSKVEKVLNRLGVVCHVANE